MCYHFLQHIDLTSEEVADLFDSVHKIGSIVEKLYGASALNIAVQVSF